VYGVVIIALGLALVIAGHVTAGVIIVAAVLAISVVIDMVIG
jgi:hypothetical protein